MANPDRQPAAPKPNQGAGSGRASSGLSASPAQQQDMSGLGPYAPKAPQVTLGASNGRSSGGAGEAKGNAGFSKGG